MSTYSRTFATVGLLAIATTVAAQERDACPVGWGSAFGVTGIQCPTCSVKRDATGRQTFTFFAEPIVLQAAPTSVLVAGDIVEAVNGHPITTSAGSEQFARPAAGPNEITVRRSGDRRTLSLTITAASAECERALQSSASRADSITILLNEVVARLKAIKHDPPVPFPVRDSLAEVLSAASARLAAATVRLNYGAIGDSRFDRSTRAIFVIDGQVIRDSVTPPALGFDDSAAGRFGFAVACTSTCQPAPGNEGKTMFTYYKYSSYPPVIAVLSGSAAEHAGIRVGDVITKVDGLSVLDEAGALKLSSMRWKDSIRLTVLREGKETAYLVTTR
ncbi:MAG: PDZ domain-containing protein [bacterium]